MLEHVQLVLTTYTRAFLAQSVGLIGLLWCLADRQVLLGTILFCLLMSDQIVFLRARFAPEARHVPFGRILNTVGLLVSLVDVLIVFAIAYRTLGLAIPDAAGPAGAVDSLAFSLASFIHFDIGLRPSSSGGRLLAGCEAALGLVLVASAIWWAMRPREQPPLLLPKPEHQNASEKL